MNAVLNDSDIFDRSLFANPDPFYWPGYFWMWNDRLDGDIIASRLSEMNSRGSKSVWALPVPGNFRPASMPTNLEPDFLSEEYLNIYREYVRTGQRLDMRIWLYDDGGWPSGSICGRIVRDNPAFASQTLIRQVVILKPGEPVESPGDALVSFLCDRGTVLRKLVPGEKICAQDTESMTVEIYRVKHEVSATLFTPAYPDLLNPEAVKEFIRRSHEVYRECIGEYFGNIVPMVFSDEAKVSNPPWTEDLPGDFKKKYGYSLIDRLPDIFRPGSTEGQQVRIDYFDWWSDRFSQAFLGQIRDWCRKNSLLSAGHLGGEDFTLGSRVHGFGHILRALRKFDVPGVDTIWRQIFPGKMDSVEIEFDNPKEKTRMNVSQNHHFPKYASSVAHQEGLKWSLTESFGVYGSGLTLEQMKWITDFQYVRGINLMTVSCTHLTVKEYLMARERPMFIPENPLWEFVSLFHSYAARLSYVLSLGRPVAEAAVYFPVRDIWAAGPELDIIAASNDMLVKKLLENRCDFDFIDDDILERDSTRVKDGKLEVGPMKYDTVYISRTVWMSKESRRKVSEFSSGGGCVIWVGNDDFTGYPGFGTGACFNDLEKHIKPLIRVEPSNNMIRMCKRQLDNGSLYFITNEDAKAADCVIEFDETLSPVCMDAETGECYKIKEAAYSDGKWRIPFQIDFAGSYLVFFTDENIQSSRKPLKPGEVLNTLKDGWMCRKMKTYRIGEHNFELDDNPDEKPLPIELGDWQDTLGGDFSGTAEYTVLFRLSGIEAKMACLINLGSVRYNCEVVLNGTNLGKKAWNPYMYRIGGIAREGLNELRVFVTNTLANQYVSTHVFDRWPFNILSGYHRIALAFEKDSTPSGLYGPVQILSEKE